ncbi:uncharacterized protein LOC100678161 [Nasonia vitripennis]|uniref:Antimicrobial peptide n=1 Tax=Nasonia vitripennis TaxID=7425 RepID=A0A7M7LS55_NASVI|nr:uncharacterized protein LOC100678161 [Nasonia vitripennis]
MMLKALFIVLIGCAVAFASPVKRDALAERSIAKEVTKIGSGFKELIKEIFAAIVGQIGGAIADNLQGAFRKLGERLHTKEYKEGVQEFFETMQKLEEAEDKL